MGRSSTLRDRWSDDRGPDRDAHRASWSSAAATSACTPRCACRRSSSGAAPTTVEVIVVDPRSYMTYQPFLPEAAAGNLEPRHVVVPLRRVLQRCEVLTGRVDDGRPRAASVARVQPDAGRAPTSSTYDHIVVAPGSVARTLPIPGLASAASASRRSRRRSPAQPRARPARRRATSTTDRGARSARADLRLRRRRVRRHRGARPSWRTWPATRPATTRTSSPARPALRAGRGDRPDPARGRRGHGRYTVEQLRKRNIDVRLDTRLESCVDGHVVLSDGDEFDADTLVWTAGVKANPMLADTDLPVDDKGRLHCRADLRVEGVDGRLGRRRLRGRARPDRHPGRCCSPSAQHAVRQAKRLADNIAAGAARRSRRPYYTHKHVGSVASLGLHKGVAQVYGIKLRGLPGLVHAPDLPREPGADLQPQGAGGRRLDPGAVLPARGRVAGLAAATPAQSSREASR